MTVADIADSLTQTTYDHPRARVYLTDALTNYTNGTGGTRTYRLMLDSLSLRMSPDIDSAEFTYYHGEQVPFDVPTVTAAFAEDVFTQDDLLRMWVKVVIPDTVGSSDITWFGLIDTVETTGGIVGTFKCQAVGVLKMAEHCHVRTSHCPNATNSNVVELGVGLPFNTDSKDYFGANGNRSTDPQFDPIPHYVFSRETRNKNLWTAHTAVEYLLARHCPKNSQGEPSPQWRLDPSLLSDSPLTWYECQVNTDGQTLKQLLDELIPRKRAVGYRVDYDDTTKDCVLKVYSFAAQDVLVRSTDTEDIYLRANPNKKQITLDEKVWFHDIQMSESVDAEYDRVVAIGERRTSTFTVTLDRTEDQFVADWTTAEEDDYKDAASVSDKAANARFRTLDRYQSVYCRFRLSDTWDGVAWNNPGVGDPTYWANPKLDEHGDAQDLVQSGLTGYPEGETLRPYGVRLMTKLPLKDRLDYSGSRLGDGNVATELAALITAGENDPENISPMFWLYETGPYYTPLDKLSTVSQANTTASRKRSFGCHVSIAHNEPAIEIKPSGGHQTLIARSDFTSPAPAGVYDATWDPVAKNGFDYDEISGTICVEWEHRLRCEALTGDEPPPEKQERVLYIEARDARLDYLVPDTVVSINNSGDVVRSDGGWLRDDRPRVQSMVNATAEWYALIRRAIKLSYRQPRKLCDIGDLITEVTGLSNLGDVRTASTINLPVTAITYSMGDGNSAGSTQIETGFAEVDFG